MIRRSFCAGLIPLATAPALGLGAESPERPPDRRRTPEPVDLSGRWILTMPVGAQWNATIERDSRGDQVHLWCGAVLLRGRYELAGRRLSIVRPEDEKMIGLVWKVRNKNLLELVEHPVSSQFGSDYRGAILVRRIDEDWARGNES